MTTEKTDKTADHPESRIYAVWEFAGEDTELPPLMDFHIQQGLGEDQWTSLYPTDFGAELVITWRAEAEVWQVRLEGPTDLVKDQVGAWLSPAFFEEAVGECEDCGFVDGGARVEDKLPRAVANLAKLPPVAYSVAPGGAGLIAIRKGVKGYEEVSRRPGKGESWDELANRMNASLGVTELQVEAMLTGSMFGWHVPGADVDYIKADRAARGKA